MALIKAETRSQAVRFQWRDIEAEATELLAEARRQGERLIAEARAAVESVRESAVAEGFERGHAEGMAEGREVGRNAGLEEGRRVAIDEYKPQLQATVSALDTAVGEAVRAKENFHADAVGEMVELAIAIARRVTKQQAAFDPRVLVANMREALALAGRRHQLRLAVHPAQRQVLSAAMPQLEIEWPGLGTAQIVEDASISLGGCRVFTEHGQIDADLEAQLDRVVAGLLPPQSKGEAA